jgi:hypothetical protein
MILYGVMVVLFSSVAYLRADWFSRCGDKISGEFRDGDDVLTYKIRMAAGEILRVSGESEGDSLGFSIAILAPASEADLASDTWESEVGDDHQNPSVGTGVLLAGGTYTINLIPNGAGPYTMYISCTLRDGRVIEPGDQSSTESTSQNASGANSGATASGAGFPGVPPVDFSDVAAIPLSFDLLMGGAITPTGDHWVYLRGH